MIDYELKKIKEIFARLFVVAVHNKMNLYSFTTALEKSVVVNAIEKDEYTNFLDESIDTLFFSFTGIHFFDEGFGYYNDAYWCGVCYFELFYEIKKSFSYLFLKLPLEKMLEMYKVYHEMDFSQLVEQFRIIEKETTILRLLCKSKGCTLKKISEKTMININTLVRYNSSDELLYKGSFQNIMKLVKYFDVPINLFVEEINNN